MSASIRATTLVAVDPAAAFAVFTREIDAWWRRGPRFRWLTAGEGYLRFEPGQITEVDVAFAAEGDQTRVTVEHRGWEELAADHPARHGLDAGAHRNRMGVWWADLLVSARRHAERASSQGG